ncbi:unnamed protein product [Orchesella dallaii]|uniref:F-box domain-containing protein n=1 Tax=Orchesella dallaii TaxID=48710 RepID=A0ABP1Q995_9HEXA
MTGDDGQPLQDVSAPSIVSKSLANADSKWPGPMPSSSSTSSSENTASASCTSAVANLCKVRCTKSYAKCSRKSKYPSSSSSSSCYADHENRKMFVSDAPEGQQDGHEWCDASSCNRPGTESKQCSDRVVSCKGVPESNIMLHDIHGQINPIFIPSIISHISSFLSCADLKRCRLLNKQWNEECSKFLREKGLIKLTSKSKIIQFTTQFQKKTKFCQNFYFEIVKGSETDKLFDKFGPNIKYLKLDFSKSTGYHLSAEEFYNLIFIKLPILEELSLVGCIAPEDHFLPSDKRIHIKTNKTCSSSFSSTKNKYTNNSTDSPPSIITPPPILPLLKRLEIYLYNSSGKNVSKHRFLIELLSCVPNLEKISVPKVPRMLSFGMPLLHTLITTQDLNFPKLQHLDMDIALYNGSIDVLKSKEFPLKYLNAEINSTVSGESLHSLLKTYGRTLLSLQLKFPRSPVASSDFLSARSFQRLQNLTLHGYKGSLDFLEDLKLQSFGLIDNAFTIAMRREDFIEPLRAQFNYKLIWTQWHEEAYCFDCMNSSDAQLLQVFSRNFLNLRSLNLPHLNDNDLRIIYNTFPHSLQELTMENPMCSDDGLTGIRQGLFSDLEEMRKVDEFRAEPFIGNLKRLRRLEILTASNEMTDASILYGIVYCENLKVFILRNASITDIALKKLVDSTFLEHLETTMCANIRGAAVKYALEKMNRREMKFVWNKYQNRLTTSSINKVLNGNSPVTCIVP